MGNYLEEQTKKINQQYDSQLASKIQALNKQKDTTISNLNKQFENQAKEYQSQRITADNDAAVNLKNLKEAMAAVGSYRSGDNLTSQAGIRTTLGNALNSIQSAENAYRKQIDDEINKTNADTQYQITDTTNSINATRAEQLRALAEAERQREYQAAEAEKQRQFQAAQAELERQAALAQIQAKANYSSSSSSQNQYSDKEVYNYMLKEIKMNPDNEEAVLQHYYDAYPQNSYVRSYVTSKARAKAAVNSLKNNINKLSSIWPK